MNKKEVNYGNVVCGKGTTGSKKSNYGYSLKLNENEEGNKDKEEQWNEDSLEEAQWCLEGQSL